MYARHLQAILAMECREIRLTFGLPGHYHSRGATMLARQTESTTIAIMAGMVRSKSAETPALCRPLLLGISAMSKKEWVQHIEQTEGIVRPSARGDREAWKAAVMHHVEHKCSVCRQRATSLRQNRDARIRHRIYQDMGLTAVRGPLSGKVYWE